MKKLNRLSSLMFNKDSMILWCFYFLMVWILLIFVLYIFNFPLLISILEFTFSVDGIISNQELALQKVILAPFIVTAVIWANIKIMDNWQSSFVIKKWYLIIFFSHMIFYIIYYKWISKVGPQENDFFETGTFILAFCSSIIFFISAFLNVRIAFLIGFCFLIFAFEEISWGQSFINFSSPSFFEEFNFQHETNLHNFFNPIFPIAYVPFNLLLLSLLTWFSQIKFFSFFYELPSVSFVIRVSNKYSLWIVPLLLSFASIFPGFEFVEQQWSIFGLSFSVLLLVEVIWSRYLHNIS